MSDDARHACRELVRLLNQAQILAQRLTLEAGQPVLGEIRGGDLVGNLGEVSRRLCHEYLGHHSPSSNTGG